MAKPKENKQRLSDPFANLDGSDAIEFVRHLADTNEDLKRNLQKFLKSKWRSESNMEDIASSVQTDLQMLEVEEVWENSGRTRYGYQDPSEVAAEMFDSALSQYLAELDKCIKVGPIEVARSTCMGILLGIYRFERESASEFSDGVADVPRDRFDEIKSRLRAMSKSMSASDELKTFMTKMCSEWSKSNEG